MEAKGGHYVATFCAFFSLVFIVTLPTAYMVLDSYDLWDLNLTNTIIPILLRGTSRDGHQSHVTIPSKTSHKFAANISPNLSSCHDSYGRPDLLVNCCPPEAREVPVKFRAPDPAQNPMRVRRPIHRVGPEYLAQYARAVALMKALPDSDPRSFYRQAGIHCTFCTGAFDMKNSDRGLNIHRAWLFYPFHRMYLFFHERILASLINDPSFALPYWPWDHPAGMQFPELFLSDPFNDTERDPTHFAPRLVDLAYDPHAAAENLSVAPDDNLAFMYNQMVSAAATPELFLGCKRQLSDEEELCDGPGTVELAPHNSVHSWVGSAANRGRENMGSFYTAAKDPSFYPHHANIDRLFDVWRNIHDMQVPFKDPMWLDSHFYFYDENADLVEIRVSEVLDTARLGYTYEGIEALWLNHRPKPSMSPKEAKQRIRSKRLRMNVMPSGGQTLDTPIRVKVLRPEREREEREEEVLVVYGIAVGDWNDNTVKFDVYLNLADETKLGPSYREFVGTYTRLPQRPESSKNGVLKLGISEALRDLEAEKDESVLLTLLPVSTSCSRVTIGGIRIEYMKI